jgi:hypothetical protein
LDRHGAGRRMGYDASPPEVIAEAIADEIGKAVVYKPIDPQAAARVAGLIAELL